jgi:hypothetical protein
MDQREYEDLGRLAITRCRESFLLVAQLVDSDVAIASMMLAVAHDFIENAGVGLAVMKGVPKEEGVTVALRTVVESIKHSEEIQNAKKRPKNPGV